MAIAAALLGLAACDGNGDLLGPIDTLEPRSVEARADWTVERWQGSDPVGHAKVDVTWQLPLDWNGEAFRVYGKRSDRNNYVLISTVTSCSDVESGSLYDCQYTDLNVRSGQSYDYYVVAVDERDGLEFEPSDVVTADVPRLTPPPAPVGLTASPRNGAVLLRWQDGGAGDELWKYQVYLVELNGSPELYQVGETDGTGFVDLRAQNGNSYTYRVVAVDLDGHVSRMSDHVTGRPSATAPNVSPGSVRGWPFDYSRGLMVAR